MSKFLTDHDAVRANVLPEMLGEFEHCNSDAAPQWQETLGRDNVVRLTQARGKQHQKVRVEIRMFLGAVMELLIADEQELAVAQSHNRG